MAGSAGFSSGLGAGSGFEAGAAGSGAGAGVDAGAKEKTVLFSLRFPTEGRFGSQMEG